MFFSHWVESRGMLSSGISKQSQTSLESIVLKSQLGSNICRDPKIILKNTGTKNLQYFWSVHSFCSRLKVHKITAVSHGSSLHLDH